MPERSGEREKNFTLSKLESDSASASLAFSTAARAFCDRWGKQLRWRDFVHRRDEYAEREKHDGWAETARWSVCICQLIYVLTTSLALCPFAPRVSTPALTQAHRPCVSTECFGSTPQKD